MPAAKTITKRCELIVVSVSAASAMPERSAPVLIEFATKSANAAMVSTGRGMRRCNAPMSPRPLTIPMRAHIIWIKAISGQVSSAVQSSASPCCAPAIEHVAMPDGSSSAAPAMIPGPSSAKKRRMKLVLGSFFGIREVALWN